MEGYLQNLAGTKHKATDMVVAPVLEKGSKIGSDWALPCHSIILSAHSSVFAASDRHGDNMKADFTDNGHRIMRLPLSQNAARRMLQFIYGSLCDAQKMSLTEACQLAVVSHMKGIQGCFQSCASNAPACGYCCCNQESIYMYPEASKEAVSSSLHAT